jgi:hypothetical protein
VIGRAFGTDTVEIRLPLNDGQLASLGLPIGYTAAESAGLPVALRAQVAGVVQQWQGTLVRLDASISPQLLETIFTPPTPLHDGAAILHGRQLLAAACILPLSRNEQLAYTLGTRHRAALGLTEESDAFVIVVSEESRQISVAEEGRLRRRLSLDDLRAELQRVYKEETFGGGGATADESQASV